MKLIYLLLAAVCLSGCGPSQAERDAKEANQKFRDRAAALKIICDSGGTYAEFRDRELSLLACREAYQAPLADKAPAIEQLVLATEATDNLWNVKNQLEVDRYFLFGQSKEQKDEHKAAMKIIKEGAGLSYDQLKAEGGWPAYVQHGLTMVSSECAELIKQCSASR